MQRPRPLVETILYLHHQLERAADGHELNMSHYMLLHFLREEPRRASDFTVFSRLRKPGVAAIVATLGERGWLRRHRDPVDGRAQLLSLTAAGRRAIERFEADMQAALERFLGAGTVADADRTLEPFYRVWNARRTERFERWRHAGSAAEEFAAAEAEHAQTT